MRTRETLEALDRLERAAQHEGDERLLDVVGLTRQGCQATEGQPAQRLALLQTCFDDLHAGFGGPLAGIALHMARAAQAAGPTLFDDIAARQPGWESDFLKLLEVDFETGLEHLESQGSWTLAAAAGTALPFPEKHEAALEHIRRLEEHPSFTAYDELGRGPALAAHTLQSVDGPYEPVAWVRPYFEACQDKAPVAHWTLQRLDDGPWKRFWHTAPAAGVEVLEKVYADQPLTVENALATVAEHPEHLGSVEALARQQQREDWAEALARLDRLSPGLKTAGIQHLLGQGTAGLERALIAGAAPGPALLALADNLLESAPDQRLKSFLAGFKNLPFAGDASRPLARGARILLEEKPLDTPQELARLACRTSDATDRIADKFTILQQGLSEAHASSPEGWGRAALELAWSVSHQAAPKNRLWLRTAAAHHALRLFARETPSTEGEFLRFGRELFLSQWMTPDLHAPVYTALLDTLSKTTVDPLVKEKIEALPDGDTKVLADNLAQLDEFLNSLGMLVRTDEPDKLLEVGEGYLDVGGHELPVEGERSSRKAPLGGGSAPVRSKPEPLEPNHGYSEEERQQKVQVHWQDSYKDGVAVIYNPATGTFQDHTSYKDGVAGGYHPRTGQVTFESSYKDGVGMVYLPESASFRVETSYKDGVAGLRNPVTGEVTFKSSYKDGVAAAANPYSGEEKWETSYKSGVAGYYDLGREAFEFRDSYKSGIAVATNDPGHPSLTSSSSWSMDFDED